MPYPYLDANGNITGLSAAPQTNTGAWLDDTDPKVTAYLAAVGAACNPTVSVVSTSTPALNGSYSIRPQDQQNITAEVTYVQVTTSQGAAKFTNGTTLKGWPDATGALHTFSTTQFIDFAEAVAQYVDAIVAYASGQSHVQPSATVTIA